MKRPLRVLYDEQIFLLQEYGGISRYFTELIKAFDANPSLGVQPILASSTVRNQYLLRETKSFNLRQVKSKFASILHLVVQMLLARRTNEQVDLVHQTFYLPGFFTRFKGHPRALTLFDMIPEKVQSPKRLWNPHFAKRHVLRKADVIFSISESSTRDMYSEYGEHGAVTTTYLGVGSEYRPSLSTLEGQPKNYFLFVGNRDGYKDCELAIRSFSKIVSNTSGAVLLLVGGGSLKRYENELIERLGLRDSILQFSYSAQELPNIYSNAKGLIYPSRYEGFGLPLVEAMASGIPILASGTPINLEIAADCATYFTVGDESALSELMLQLSQNPISFRAKIEAGKVRAKYFTWEKCAELTAAGYRRAIEKQKARD